MLVENHIKINLILGLILLFFIKPFYVFIIFLSSILIDFDHYLYHIFEKKNFSLKKAYNWYLIERERFHNLSLNEKKKHRYFIFIFHGSEVLIIFFILSRYYPSLFFVFLGFLFHFIEDLIIATKFKYLKRKLFLSYAIYLHIKNKVK
jgi:hypothetical protein